MGQTTTGATALTFPDGANLAVAYPTATTISTGSLANVGGVPTLQTCVLSPASNPFGAVNSRGIYKIDCGGGQLTIKNCRVVGTLIVVNASLVTVDGAVVWEPAEAAMPCLLVRGRLLLKYGFGSAIKLLENGTGTEGSGVAFNSNPAGTPYPYSGGTTDTDTTDALNTLIAGLVYCSGDAEVAGPTNFHSLVSGGNVVLGNFRFRPVWENSYYLNPPPGFYWIRHTVVQGSYK